jgi:hypothetical protein
MLDRTSKPFSGAILFPTVDDFFLALFGADQHDMHVKQFRRWQKDEWFRNWPNELSAMNNRAEHGQ